MVCTPPVLLHWCPAIDPSLLFPWAGSNSRALYTLCMTNELTNGFQKVISINYRVQVFFCVILLHLDWLNQIPVPTHHLWRTGDAISLQSSAFTHFYLNGNNFYHFGGGGFCIFHLFFYLFCRIYSFKRPACILVKGISKQLGIQCLAAAREPLMTVIYIHLIAPTTYSRSRFFIPNKIVNEITSVSVL